MKTGRNLSLVVLIAASMVLAAPAHGQIENSTAADLPKVANAVEAEEALPPVLVNRDTLSVELRDAEVGEVLENIAQEVGFEVHISSTVYPRKVSVSFRGMDIERGISRLLKLVGQKNFTVRYGPEGEIVEVIVMGSKPSSFVAPQKASSRPKALGSGAPTPKPSSTSLPAIGAYGTDPYGYAPQGFTPPDPRVPRSAMPQVTMPDGSSQVLLPFEQERPGGPQSAPLYDAPTDEQGMTPPGAPGSSPYPYIPPKRKPVYISPK